MDALARLGVSPGYHMREVGKNGHQALWIEALDAKFDGTGKTWGREDFDRILGSYEAGSVIPSATPQHNRLVGSARPS